MKKKSRTAQADKYKDASVRRSEKKRKQRRSLSKKQKRIVLIAAVVVVLLGFTYVRNIITLTVQNHKLKQQEQKLIEEKARLEKVLEGVDDADFIEEEARRQLRLMNPDEILFTFDEEGEENE